MINFTRLLGELESQGDTLRYALGAKDNMHGAASGKGPVVVWNCTQQCNLRCRHCYSADGACAAAGEMTTTQGMKFIDDLAAFNVPVLLFSGGEPLMRKDFFELLEYAKSKGIRCAVSTNGTLITPKAAAGMKALEVSYVGISLDGPAEIHDYFRGSAGAYDKTICGIKNCKDVGQKVGLRITINSHNWDKIDEMFTIIEDLDINRICFYHYVPAGRGSENRADGIDNAKTRMVINKLMEKTLAYRKSGIQREILTVDNHADAVYIYQKMCKVDTDVSEKMLALLQRNGGNRSGSAIAAVDWAGNVYPDQFTRNHKIDNVLDKPFSAIWSDGASELLSAFRNRKGLLKGRCSGCSWLDICNGNLRARAFAASEDLWVADPACYLTDDEIKSERMM